MGFSFWTTPHYLIITYNFLSWQTILAEAAFNSQLIEIGNHLLKQTNHLQPVSECSLTAEMCELDF